MRSLMKTLVVILLAISALGCGGYGSGSSSNSGSMAAGTPSISPPLGPNTAAAGGAGFTLTVNGSGLLTQSVVYWNQCPTARLLLPAASSLPPAPPAMWPAQG